MLLSTKYRAPGTCPPLKATRLRAQLPERLRYLHYSYRTEQSYVYWTKFFVHFHGASGQNVSLAYSSKDAGWLS